MSSSRRDFLRSSGGAVTAAWIGMQWPAIAAAAHHAADVSGDGAPVGFEFFSAADAADVEAFSTQIVPSGATPGAREARAVYFIDRSLATYITPLAVDFRQGLGDFQNQFRMAAPAAGSFATADSAQQIAFMTAQEHTPFFDTARMLTVLGLFASPLYGGNFQGKGWKMIGFVDQHAFAPPFGYYDKDYAGFVPYSGVSSSTSSSSSASPAPEPSASGIS